MFPSPQSEKIHGAVLDIKGTGQGSFMLPFLLKTAVMRLPLRGRWTLRNAENNWGLRRIFVDIPWFPCWRDNKVQDDESRPKNNLSETTCPSQERFCLHRRETLSQLYSLYLLIIEIVFTFLHGKTFEGGQLRVGTP